MRSALKWTAGALGVAAGAYAGYVGVTWLRYGHPAPARADDGRWREFLLDNTVPATWSRPLVAAMQRLAGHMHFVVARAE